MSKIEREILLRPRPISNGMKFYSTNKKSGFVNLKTALFEGLAPDGGLFMPEKIPKLPPSFIKNIRRYSFQKIAFVVASTLIGKDVPIKELKRIVKRAIYFDAPLVRLDTNTYALELYHGPTLSFKDFGARFMAELLSYFSQKEKKTITILTATSGDTGSAVAHGFFGKPFIKVVVLYPKGKISEIQERQIATLGKNITALAVKGTFDDCQTLVKTAFKDKELNKKLNLTSANSINIARLIPQTFYYFWGYAQLKNLYPIPYTLYPVFSVPCGNFGNLTAGLIAKKMGLPVAKFIASTNINDTVIKYLTTGKFKPKKSKQTLSNAMDVGNPSNFARMLDLYGHGIAKMKKDIFGTRHTDAETKKAIKYIFKQYDLIAEPHGAVGYLGVEAYRKKEPSAVGIFFETAHPAKFPEIVEKIIQQKIKVPARLKKFLNRKKKSVTLRNDFRNFKQFLLGV